MTALVQRGTLPTLEQPDDTGKAVVVNPAGDNYVLGTAQSGPSVALPGVSCAIFSGTGWTSGQSGAEAIALPGVTTMGDRGSYVTLACGPAVVSAGEVCRLKFWPNVDATVWVELFVSNAAGTEAIVVYSAGDRISLVEGVEKTFALADWDGDPSIVGTDLSINASGFVVSAAGGVFWATAYISVMPEAE